MRLFAGLINRRLARFGSAHAIQSPTPASARMSGTQTGTFPRRCAQYGRRETEILPRTLRIRVRPLPPPRSPSAIHRFSRRAVFRISELKSSGIPPPPPSLVGLGALHGAFIDPSPARQQAAPRAGPPRLDSNLQPLRPGIKPECKSMLTFGQGVELEVAALVHQPDFDIGGFAEL